MVRGLDWIGRIHRESFADRGSKSRIMSFNRFSKFRPIATHCTDITFFCD